MTFKNFGEPPAAPFFRYTTGTEEAGRRGGGEGGRRKMQFSPKRPLKRKKKEVNFSKRSIGRRPGVKIPYGLKRERDGIDYVSN